MNLDWNEARARDYDLVFVTCGYEKRATFARSQMTGTARHLIVLDYGSTNICSYDTNRDWLSKSTSADWIDLQGATWYGELQRLVEIFLRDLGDEAQARVLVDISSCSRRVLASLLTLLAEASEREILLTCVYAVSEYFNPPDGELPCTVSEPVLGDMSGWSHDLSKPPCAIISLGFEPGRALGSIDYLEVPEVRLFLPEGPDQRFMAAVREANELLLTNARYPALTYDVSNPEDTYQKLESLILGLLPEMRPIIIPLGPKIFAALAMLLALKFFPQLCVWRISAGSGEEFTDRGAGGTVVAFEYLLRRPEDRSVERARQISVLRA